MFPHDLIINTAIWQQGYSVLGIYLLLELLCTIPNCLLIVAIWRFHKLHNVTNIILAHFLVFQSVYFFGHPACAFIFSLITRKNLYCNPNVTILRDVEAFLVICLTLFLMLLLIDWFLKVYSESSYVHFKRMFRYILTGMYLFCLCLLIAVIVLIAFVLNLYSSYGVMRLYCRPEWMLPSEDKIFVIALWILPLLPMLPLLLFIISVIVLNIVHQMRKRDVRNCQKVNVGLFVANCTLVLWLPIFVSSIVYYSMGSVDSVTGETVDGVVNPLFVVILLYLLQLSSPTVCMIYLYRREPDFRTCLRTIFTCKSDECRKANQEDIAISLSNDAEHV